MARLKASGEVLWQNNLPVTPYGPQALHGIAELADGRIAVSGAYGGGGCVLVLDSGGKVLFGSGAGHNLLAVQTFDRHDGLAAVGYYQEQGVIATFTDQGKVGWVLNPPGAVACFAVVPREDDTVEAWCIATNAQNKRNDVARLVISASGSVVSFEHFPTPASIHSLSHAVDGGGNTFVAANVWPGFIATQKQRVHLFKFDAKGNQQWQRLVAAPSTGRYSTDIAFTTAGPVVLGNASSGPSSEKGELNGWLAGIDSSGHIAWERDIGGVGQEGIHAGVLLDGNLFLVGATNSKGAGNFDEWLVRTDAWGQGPCSQSGPCVKLAATACLDDQACTVDTCSPIDGCVHEKSTCDDGNPCTTDACDAKAGCQWTPLSDGTAACPNGGQCALGYCP